MYFIGQAWYISSYRREPAYFLFIPHMDIWRMQASITNQFTNMSGTDYETIQVDGKKVAVLTMRNPPVNSLSMATRVGLANGTEKALR